MRSTIYIGAGGTGGHISPAVALAHGFCEKSISVVFFTLEKNQNYPDILALRKNPLIKLVFYPAPQFPRKPHLFFSFIKNMFLSLKYVHHEYKQNPPLAVIGMGGYPSFPLLFYAAIRQIPFFLCEQNAVLSFVNKIFAPFAKRVFISFPLRKNKKNFFFSGNPLRPMFSKKLPEKKSFQKSQNKRRIFMIGGSQGASQINELYLAMAEDPFFKDWEITLSTGKEEYEAIKQKARKKDRIFSFIEDMPKELSQASVILCRAGSGTLYELSWAAKAAILFPYPYATKNHQWFNALYLKEKGIAEIIDIRPFNRERALIKVKEILSSPQWEKMQKEAQKRNALPLNAQEVIIREILSILS